MIDWLLEEMDVHAGDLALATPTATYTYADLLSRTRAWHKQVASLGAGSVVSIEGGYGLDSIAAFLALTWAGHVIVPMSPDSKAHHMAYLSVSGVDVRIVLPGSEGEILVESTGRRLDHPIYATLRRDGHPGLVLFSSGSTGQPKAAVHDLDRLLAKFRVPRRRYRTLVFLLFDHIGGVNTLFYTLSNGGALVLPRDRSAAAVCDAIEAHDVELLPTSPTFLNVLRLSGEAATHRLRSVRLITYGTEPMPASTLEHACRMFPQARFQQTYGLTELGILRSQSRSNSSLWVRVGGEDFDCKVVGGQLWVRAQSAMLGYLNAPSPFDADGYFATGDLVETDGDWLRFLGRQSDVINVGGSKVHPAEVESVMLQMDNIADVVVWGESHAMIGQIVVATVRLREPEEPAAFKMRLRHFCQGRLSAHQIPAKVRFTEEAIHSARFKRLRRQVTHV